MVARRFLRIWDGLNTATLRGVIGTCLPVFGFLPIRGPFLRTTKVPNEESFTGSPRSKQLEISLSTSATNAADSDRDKTEFLLTASHDPPPLKWSDLKYVFWHQGGPNAEEASQA